MEYLQEIYEYSIFGERYSLPVTAGDCETKEKVLMNATVLFARKGYEGVTMRDIARSIGIKPASLYNHYASKELLWKAVLEHAKNLYLLYFQQLGEQLAEASTFEEVLEIFFAEPKRLGNLFTCYAFTLIRAEQFRDSRAAELYTGIILEYSIGFIAGWFAQCAERGLVRPFDYRTAAALIMNTVMTGLDLRVQEHMGRPLSIEPVDLFTDLQKYILQSVRQR